ncbi:MAG: Flp pilus assembly complex ATPase component TadA [Desulfobacterota bacterium]|jgi:type IV pilus assembly protein PilB|nr:Flp pilus assembly complex ATPase component TadA [Thermodesulfobacteriota bacterium]
MAQQVKDSGIISLTSFQENPAQDQSRHPEIKASEDVDGPILQAEEPKEQESHSQPSEDLSLDVVRFLIQEGHITSAQLEYAKNVQEKLDTPKRLSAVLRELGYVEESEIRETLRKNRTGMRLGSLLVELNYISEDQLRATLSQQRQGNSSKRLGELLIENHYITEFELAQALSVQLGYPYVDLRPNMVDPSLAKKASKQFLLTHRILPLGKENGTVRIAMADPLDSTALAAVQEVFGAKLTLCIALESALRESLDTFDRQLSPSKKVEVEEHEVVKLVNQLLSEALKTGASDIHIEPLAKRTRVRMRKDGSLIQHMELPRDLHASIVARIKVMAKANIAEKRRHQDGRILFEPGAAEQSVDIRASFYVTIFGEKVVMRLLTRKAGLYKVGDLGMGAKVLDRFVEEVLELPTGVVIITGPTGSGKTTTLYASINHCNRVDTSIITAEEPVEYVIEGISQCPIDPKIGLTFEESLRHILRQDPDIIILGEIRDKQSAESAIQAALTGHKVLTTFHTEDSIGGLLRLMNMDIEAFLISSTVVCVLAQRLIKRVCPHCRKSYLPSAKDLRRLQYEPQSIQGYSFSIGAGCSRCSYTGYQGRTGIFEILILNEHVKEAIRKRKTSYAIRRISVETTGLVTLLEDGIVKAARGITSIPEVLRNLPLLDPPRPLDQIHRLIGEI